MRQLSFGTTPMFPGTGWSGILRQLGRDIRFRPAVDWSLAQRCRRRRGCPANDGINSTPLPDRQDPAFCGAGCLSYYLILERVSSADTLVCTLAAGRSEDSSREMGSQQHGRGWNPSPTRSPYRLRLLLCRWRLVYPAGCGVLGDAMTCSCPAQRPPPAYRRQAAGTRCGSSPPRDKSPPLAG